jgi:hypothetical protein
LRFDSLVLLCFCFLSLAEQLLESALHSRRLLHGLLQIHRLVLDLLELLLEVAAGLAQQAGLLDEFCDFVLKLFLSLINN